MEMHGISEGDVVRVTDVSSSKAIDQSSDEWSGNLELGQDEIIEWLTEGTVLEVRRIKEPIRGPKYTVVFNASPDDSLPNYRSVVASTYESWPNNASSGYHFDADGHTTHYSDKYFDVALIDE